MMCAQNSVRRSRGVTLLELLVVLTLMAFIVAIVLPTLGGGVSTTALKSASLPGKWAYIVGLPERAASTISSHARTFESTLENDLARRPENTLVDRSREPLWWGGRSAPQRAVRSPRSS